MNKSFYIKILNNRAIACLLVFFIATFCACGGQKKQSGEQKETPKKYFTLCFDDGTVEDEKMIDLLKKYNLKATFCLNTGLMDGNNYIEVGGSWQRISFDYAKQNNVYGGFDLISHGYNHKELKNLSYDEIVFEIIEDSKKIKQLSGVLPVGLAYPGGTNYYDDYVISTLLSGTSVRFARDTDDTHLFDLPDNFMCWKPTCSILDSSLLNLAKKFIQTDYSEDTLFFVWDHPWAVSAYNSWNKVEEFFKLISGREDIVYVTNTEFYELFKDKILSKTVW